MSRIASTLAAMIDADLRRHAKLTATKTPKSLVENLPHPCPADWQDVSGTYTTTTATPKESVPVSKKSEKSSTKKAAKSDEAEAEAEAPKAKKGRTSSPETLEKREKIHVLRADGLSIGKIAAEMDLNPTTVLYHLSKPNPDGGKKAKKGKKKVEKAAE